MMEQSPSADNPQATLTTEDLAWLGGLIDGEGCIYLSRRNRKRMKKGNAIGRLVNYRPGVLISNADPFIIEEAHRIIDLAGIGHWVTWSNPSKQENRRSQKMMGVVHCMGYKRCQAFLPIIIPYVRAKRDQAKVLLEYIDRRIEIKPTTHNSYGYEEDYYFNRLHELKQKEAPETIRGYRSFVNEERQDIVRTA